MRCRAADGTDLFCEELPEKEIDDLLSFKKVFDSEVDFIDIDFGVKGTLNIKDENETDFEVYFFLVAILL